jgi:hypothetical protein
LTSGELPCASAASDRPRTAVISNANSIAVVSIIVVLFIIIALSDCPLGLAHRLAGGTMLFIRRYSTI